MTVAFAPGLPFNNDPTCKENRQQVTLYYEHSRRVVPFLIYGNLAASLIRNFLRRIEMSKNGQAVAHRITRNNFQATMISCAGRFKLAQNYELCFG